jgi:hypothetical protein
MNKIYLDKLCEFTNKTYKLYNEFVKKITFNDTLESIKQNSSLNEKGIFNKYNFIEINNIISDFEFNELILLMPITFNICDNINWYNLLNSLLLILNNDYIYETNIKKKLILETTNGIYSKKINISNNITKEFLIKVSNISNICLIIINYNCKIIDVQVYNKNDNVLKYVVLFKDNDNIFPFINWDKKYYEKTNEFIKYLLKLNEDFVLHEEVQIITPSKLNEIIINNQDNKKDKSKKNKSKLSIDNDIIDNSGIHHIFESRDTQRVATKFDSTADLSSAKVLLKPGEINKKDACYEELITNENYALYISEVIDNKKEKKNTITPNLETTCENFNTAVSGGTQKRTIPSDSKKKSKNSKDIFLPKDLKEENKEHKKNKDEESVFRKTEVISKEEIAELIKSIKTTFTLSYVQEVAIKLDILTVAGSTKTGKPKNKTKLELLEEIQTKFNTKK